MAKSQPETTPISLQTADKLQNELRRAYESKDFQAKLQALHDTMPDHAERMKAFKELMWHEQASILPKYGFQANQRGNIDMLCAFIHIQNHPVVLRNTNRINRALRLAELDQACARMTKTYGAAEAAAQKEVDKSIASVPTALTQARPFLDCMRGSGKLPLVLSAPHDGGMMPADIPDRKGFGTWGRDWRSSNLAFAIRDRFAREMAPALIVNRLARRKMDANRPCCDGVGVVNEAGFTAWAQYHNTLSQELRRTVRRHGFVLLLDIHGQSHRKATELGYLLTSKDLLLPDEVLEGKASSVDSILRRGVPGRSIVQLVRGESSFGALLEKRGFNCTPSPREPCPVSEADMTNALSEGVDPPRFYAGNYTTRRYGAPGTVSEQDNPLSEHDQDLWAKQVAVIQLETESLARDGGSGMANFAGAVCEAVFEFLSAHCGWSPSDDDTRGTPDESSGLRVASGYESD